MAQWTGLLKWSLAYHDGTRDVNDTKPLSQEDQDFLSKVMDSIVVDEVKRIRVIIEILRWPEDPVKLREMLTHSNTLLNYSRDGKEAEPTALPTNDTELVKILVSKKLDALDELDERVGRIDYANDFLKMEGFPILLETLRSAHSSLHTPALQAFSTIVANNPKAQVAALEAGFMPVLFGMWDNAQRISAKVLTALGGLSRACRPTEKAFVEAGGIARLVRDVASKHDTSRRTQEKALRFLAYFLEDACPLNKQIAPALVELKVVEAVTPLFAEPVTADNLEDGQEVNLRDAEAVFLKASLRHVCLYNAFKPSAAFKAAALTRLNSLRKLCTNKELVGGSEMQFEVLQKYEKLHGIKTELTPAQKEHAQSEVRVELQTQAMRDLEAQYRRETNFYEATQREEEDKARGTKG